MRQQPPRPTAPSAYDLAVMLKNRGESVTDAFVGVASDWTRRSVTEGNDAVLYVDSRSHKGTALEQTNVILSKIREGGKRT